MLRGSATLRRRVCKAKEGETTNDLFRVPDDGAERCRGDVHPKAMPVILRDQEEIETWLTAPAEEALKLQRPLPEGALKVVARGGKDDTVE
jgi:hypothetical protein